MKAVILAAGKGTRLGSLTEALPKPMLKVSNKPILQYNIELCRKHGITELFVNTHHCANRIVDYFGDGRNFEVSISYSFEPHLLGTAGALSNFRKWLQDEPFYVLYGDNISDYDLPSLYSYHRQKFATTTVALFYKEDVSLSGVAELNAMGRITRFIEKPFLVETTSHLVNSGVYVLSPDIFRYIPQGFADFGFNVFPKLISEQQNLFGLVMTGRLEAADTPEYLEALLRKAEL